MTWTPPPGAIALTYAYGFTGFRASLGQALLAENTSYNHAFIVLNEKEIIEPWPSGVRLSSLRNYDGEYVAYGFLPGLNESEQALLASAALSLDGVRHGMRDHVTLALHRYGWHSRRVRRQLTSKRRLLPAQFVVEVYRRAGLELFPGFQVGDVTMEDVGELLLMSAQWELRVPCAEFGYAR